ncbi:MAG: hypothetical protein AAGB13_00820 [Cyanobacteria bacterium P01_F01_bin.33]
MPERLKPLTDYSLSLTRYHRAIYLNWDESIPKTFALKEKADVESAYIRTT